MKKLLIFGLIVFCFMVSKVEAQKIIPVTSRIGNGNYMEYSQITWTGKTCDLSDKPYFIEGGDELIFWQYSNDSVVQLISFLLTFLSPVGNLHLDFSEGCFLINITGKDISGQYDGYFFTLGSRTLSGLVKRGAPKEIINFVCLGESALYNRPDILENWLTAQIDMMASVVAFFSHPLPTVGPITLSCHDGNF